MSLSNAAAATLLARLGWRVNTTTRYRQAVRDFQTGWNLGTRLVVDGTVGPKTSAALALSESRRRAGRGTASANFDFVEFRCKCDGRYSSCRRIWIDRGQVQRLERYRARLGAPVSIVSGCRCESHNRAVGGASDSRHRLGTATDFEGRVGVTTLRSWAIFSGLGYKASTGRVLHGDNRSTGTVARPTVWRYS